MDAADVQHGLSSLQTPPHAAAFHSVYDQILAGTFDHAGGDGVTGLSILIVFHAGCVAFEVAADRVDRLEFLAGDGAHDRLYRWRPSGGGHSPEPGEWFDS